MFVSHFGIAIVIPDVKGVSDLEMCLVYFVLPGRSCENLNFPVHLKWHASEKNLATSQTSFAQT